MNANLVKALMFISGANGKATEADRETLEDIISQTRSQLNGLNRK